VCHFSQHLFREPEKRPSAVVSNVFTVLTVAPILVLVIMVRSLVFFVSYGDCNHCVTVYAPFDMFDS